ALTLQIHSGARAAEEVTFAGKRITVFIGYSPGGIGYDTYGRHLARYLGKYLPGNPTIIASNRPGAGSMTLANYMYNVAPHDGTEIAMVGRGIATDPLINGAASTARFDASKFNWLGSMNNEVSGLYLREGAPAKSLKDLLAGTRVEAGSTGAGGDQQVFSQALNVLLHMNLHIIPGYPGTNEILLGMLGGELDAIAGYSWSAAKIGNANEIRSGQIKIVLQLALKKHPELPDVPLVTELIKDESGRQALELIMSRQSMGRPVVAPPGVPPAIVLALRKAVADVMNDADFKAEADSLGLETSYVSGEDVQALVQKMYALPPEIVAAAQKAVAP
ncbi:MAG: tripartite tricarboxylate transporter family receptor, partial [Hyphomicrobiales bacterium]|nr:tripartite tricarboxylate transporter family receptor [Hyphomicrobiales bacterium]